MLVAYLLAKMFKEKYRKIINKMTKNSIFTIGAISLLILICMSSLFHKIKIAQWQLNSTYLLDATIIIIMGIIGIFIVMQRIEYDKKDRQYKDLAKFSETNGTLLEEYSMINHEHRNQLVIIESMIENKDKELAKYVRNLIDKKDNIKFKWIRDLNNINFTGLKSFINYKILEMQEEKINVLVTISKECKNYKLEDMSLVEKEKLYSIIGVYLDNAKEASSESKDKEVQINGYVLDDEMYLEIANTYKGEVDIDKINNYGYTSKGAGHGTGLHMIQTLIKDSKTYKTETRIDGRYFIQTLHIDLNKITNKKES